MKISARFLLFVFFLASLFVLFSKQSNAQTTQSIPSQYTNIQYAPNLNPDVPRDQHSYTQSVMIEVMSSMVCQIGGFDLVRPNQKCLGVDPQTGKLGFVENGGGALGAMSKFIAYTFTPLTSSSEYARYLAGNFGFPKKTYAADCSDPDDAPRGVGFCGITPLIGIWTSMRNIVYLLFVVIFTIVGLAIMFRVHIDPRTVMTIQNQIPKIIVGLILVTFSFAIAGFLIDVMYVAIYLVAGVLVAAQPLPDGITVNTVATSPTPFDAINSLWGGFGELSTQGKETVEGLMTSALTDGIPPHGLFDILADLPSAMVGLLLGIVAYLIILIAIIYTAIRLWIILVVAYISVLLDIVFAPFWILIGLLPGSSLGVGAWFKDILANLAVFPTAIAMLILAKIFSEVGSPRGCQGVPNCDVGQLFTPPLVGGAANAGSEVFAGIIALGFLFMLPHVLQVTRSAIKAPNINYGPVFQPAGAAGGTVAAGASGYAAYSTKMPMPGEKGGRQAITRRIFKF